MSTQLTDQLGPVLLAYGRSPGEAGEAVGDPDVVGVPNEHPSGSQLVGIQPAFVAQRIEIRGLNQRGRKSRMARSPQG